jgi:hypothetical protein
LFQGIDLRVFFGQTANVTAEITEIAAAIADEQVDQTLRDKLREVFRPRTNALYSDKMAILPALDEIQLVRRVHGSTPITLRRRFCRSNDG